MAPAPRRGSLGLRLYAVLRDRVSVLLAIGLAAAIVPGSMYASIEARADNAILLVENTVLSPSSLVTGVGVVVAKHPDFPALTVDHEDMPGFMSAMEMMYYVQSVDMLEDLKPGDKIRFTIDTAVPPTIKKIEILKPAD